MQIANERIAFNEDWTRMAIILGTVTAFSIFSGFSLNHQKVTENYS